MFNENDIYSHGSTALVGLRLLIVTLQNTTLGKTPLDE